MILYCDTSALVKIYIDEIGSNDVHALVDQAGAVAACRIAWAEAHAALARRARESSVDVQQIEEAKTALARDWSHFLIVEVSQALVEQAGEFADTFALRAYDSMQLAAAHATLTECDMPVFFASCDLRLNKAAKLLGMRCW